MSATASLVPIERLTRPGAIETIRHHLARLTAPDRCTCSTAARYGVPCPGFRGVSDDELRRRYHWIFRSREGVSRDEMERLITLYHLGRMESTHATLCCDVETRERCGCDGWNRVSNADLESFVFELSGRNVRIG